MKQAKFFLFTLFIFSFFSLKAAVFVLSGHVENALTKDPLPGATISITDLRISVISDQNGDFIFKNIPAKGKFLVEVKYLGFATQTRTVDLSSNTPVSFSLKPSVIEAHEVVVTGSALSSDNRKNSTNVTAVSRTQLIEKPSSSLIDAISRTAGVSQVTTGASVSKPVIRGLSYNRVLTLVDGAKQEGQQWGDEHGIEVDQYNTGRVEILRGAAGLLYGSDALGGVINILDPLPAPEGKIRGEILSNYATNNGQSGNSLMFEGNQNGFIWKTRGSYKNAFAYKTPRGYVANTGYNETNLSSQIGLNKSWGYAHLNLSSFNNKLGLPDFEQNDEGKFLDEDGKIFSNSDLTKRELLLPYQNINHYKAAVNSNILFGSSHLHATLAYQDNQRRELEESRIEPSLFFDLKTYSYDLKYYLNETGSWEPVLGVSGAFQNNTNKAEEKLIPDYNSNDFGAFGYIKKTWTKSTFNAGARYDYRNIKGVQMLQDGEPKFSNFGNSFSNISGALGFTHEFSDKFSFKANAGTAFRAPNIAELSSQGIHEGTFRYESGNTQLKPEKSYYGDVALEFDTDKLHAGISVFENYIKNYIFPRHNPGDSTILEGGKYPVFNYTQANANLYGAEASLTLHPVALVHFDTDFSFTIAENRATQTPLPFIPAARLRNELRLEPQWKSGAFGNSFLSIELNSAFNQARADIFETATPAYTLVNAALGTTLRLNKLPVHLNLSVNNIFDKAYSDHLSRLKYEGILNQGRNVSFGVFVPFTVK